MMELTTYFLCLSLSKLQQMEKFINGEDFNPVSMCLDSRPNGLNVRF